MPIYKSRDLANYLMERWNDQKMVDAALYVDSIEYEADCPNIAIFIIVIFNWSSTPQGGQFWEKIADEAHMEIKRRR